MMWKNLLCVFGKRFKVGCGDVESLCDGHGECFCNSSLIRIARLFTIIAIFLLHRLTLNNNWHKIIEGVGVKLHTAHVGG